MLAAVSLTDTCPIDDTWCSATKQICCVNIGAIVLTNVEITVSTYYCQYLLLSVLICLPKVLICSTYLPAQIHFVEICLCPKRQKSPFKAYL